MLSPCSEGRVQLEWALPARTLIPEHRRFELLYKNMLSEVALSRAVPEVSAWRTGDEDAVWEDQSSQLQHFIFCYQPQTSEVVSSR